MTGVPFCHTAEKLGPWPAHAIEHQLSAWYDVTHGHGLAVVIPALLRHILNETSAPVIAAYGVNVFGIIMGSDVMETAERAIDKTEEFFQSLGLGLKLKDLGIESEEHFDKMAEVALTDGLDGCLVDLTKEDIVEIYKDCE
ncbi:MAG: iron-containing alcohol dehydrogenase [Lachnospiraceae bacterium]|nr:iron-containing alcohol dehydrogenase [Lachnospiraceae bacterium]